MVSSETILEASRWRTVVYKMEVTSSYTWNVTLRSAERLPTTRGVNHLISQLLSGLSGH